MIQIVLNTGVKVYENLGLRNNDDILYFLYNYEKYK